MKHWLGRFFQRNAHSVARRAWFRLLPAFGAVFGKSQRVYFLDVGGQRYKRVVFGDAFQAAEVERLMLTAARLEAFPPLVHRHENELLVGFVEGRALDTDRDGERLAAFLGDVNALAPREVGLADSGLPVRLGWDLDFLQQAGVVDEDLAERLERRARSLAPETIRLGIDYVDPVAKNFVVRDDRIVAIDVESLRDGVALGTGLAQAAVHWLPRDRAPGMLGAMQARGAPDLARQYPYVELCFRVAWTKRKLLQGKRRFVRRENLETVAGD